MKNEVILTLNKAEAILSTLNVPSTRQNMTAILAVMTLLDEARNTLAKEEANDETPV